MTAHDAVFGRVRLRDPRLRGRADLCAMLAGVLLAGDMRRSVDVSPLTGSVLVRAAVPLDSEALRSEVADLLDNGGAAALCAHALSAAAASSAADGGYPTEPWHARPIDTAVLALGSDSERGLDEEEALRRIVRHGRNVLPRAEPRSPLAIFGEQLESLPVALLGVSAVLSLITGGLADAVVIMGVVLVNAGIATATERQAERTIAGLSGYDPHPVKVVRGGRAVAVDPAEIVPGDLLLLEPGTLIPADARLVLAENLTVNEAALTGEAMPAHKAACVILPNDNVLADRSNMVFRGTAVTGGRGLAMTVATAGRTEIGQIQGLLGSLRPPETPIQRQLGEIERELVLVNGVICAVVFGIGLLRGHTIVSMLRSAISLAVAAIPEGLPAVATTTLALGIQDMRRRKVYVRRLDAVETLGAVEVIGLDKTGTLTGSGMSLAAIHVGGRMLRAAGDGDVPWRADRAGDPVLGMLVDRLFAAAALASEATFEPGGDGWTRIVASSTETALLEAAAAAGLDPVALAVEQPLLELVPRSDGRKRVSALRRGAGGSPAYLAVKGDPAEVLARCAFIRTGTGTRPITTADRLGIMAANEAMAGAALRVLGVAERPEGGDPRAEADLTWLGVTGIENPVRPHVRAAIRDLHRAGIKTVMITGDQSATAYAVAKDLNLAEGSDIRVLEAGRLAQLTPELLAAIAAGPDVFARVSPTEKLSVVRALQGNGSIVAMTGDGINDGPALKAADIGIAMGAEGSDVAREVADIVLATDDLEGLVEAVRLGRATYANIRKVLRFLVGTNASETFVMLGAGIAGLAEPLTPLQLLLLNLVTDVFPALALGLEPPEADVLDRPPHDPRAPILDRGDFLRVVREGSVIGTAALSGFLCGTGAAGARSGGTIAFHGLILAQLLHAFSCRSEDAGIWHEFERAPNLRLRGAVVGCLGIQAGVQLIPFTRRLFRLAPVGIGGVAAILAIAVTASLLNETIAFALDRDLPPNGAPP